MSVLGKEEENVREQPHQKHGKGRRKAVDNVDQ
jgi:hypothetical protein